MDKYLLRAHRLAAELELMRCRSLASKRLPAEHYYDPHAMTELGDLIYNRMRADPPAPPAGKEQR